MGEIRGKIRRKEQALKKKIKDCFTPERKNSSNYTTKGLDTPLNITIKACTGVLP